MQTNNRGKKWRQYKFPSKFQKAVIPRIQNISITDLKHKIQSYVNALYQNVLVTETKPKFPYRIMKLQELNPEIQELCGICAGAISDEDLNGSLAKEEDVFEKYGK